MSDIVKQVTRARLVSTPLVCIRTADPAGTMAALTKEIYHPEGEPSGYSPILIWDLVRGLVASNDKDHKALSVKAHKLTLGEAEQAATNNPTETLVMLQRCPPGTVVFWQNAQRFMDDASIVQGIWNLRDAFKSDTRMLILLCPSITLPAELQQDVLVLDEPLPGDALLQEIAIKLYEEVDIPKPSEEILTKIVDATLGLAAFSAEQSIAMALEPTGVEISDLWERKRSLIDGNPGLSVWRGGDKFEDIGGCDNIKGFLKDVINGEQPPRAIVFCDEIEKGVGTSTDSSGVAQAQMGQLLTWMQDNEANGMILVGIPGTAKSAIAKAAGNEAGIPTIALDLAGTKNSLVGESEARLRQALKVIDAVSQKRALWIATCNSIAILPPELKRRFTMGVFYFDLPSTEEKSRIWKIYRKKYELSAEYELPDDTGWTGAEIKQCASLSWRLRRPLIEAASFVVPVSKSAPEQVEKLRTQAEGRFISVSYPGVYRKDIQEIAATAVAQSGRRVKFTK